MSGPSVADVLARAGMRTRVVAGATGLPALVTAVAPAIDDTPPAGSLLVASWMASRRGGALPPLEPVLHHALGARASGLLVITGSRRVEPGPEVVSSAEHHVLPLIWVDEQVQPDTAVDVLAAAHSVLLGERASRRLLLLEALSDILAAGVDEESALRALRLLPVTSVRISAKTRGTDTLLVDWADDGPDRTASGGDVQVHVDVGAGPTPGDPPSGALELTCTRALTEDENAYAQNLVALLRLWLPTRPRADGRAADQLQDDLLHAILGADLSARETAIRRARRLGVFPPRRSVVLVVEPFGHRLTPAGLNALSRNVIQSVRLRDSKASVMVREGGILVIVAEKVDLGLVTGDLVHRVGLPICVGVSTAVASIDRLPGGYRQAQRSTTLAQQLGRVNTVTRYADLGFYRLLVLLPEHERNRFVTEILGPLAGDDAEHADLRRTLRVVGENRGNIRAAADRLFIHPNTLRQRIGKLNHLLGPFLDDADAYLNVYIALALHRLRERG